MKSDIICSSNTNITLTGNLYICLNGFNLELRHEFASDNAGNYVLYICNCTDKKSQFYNNRANIDVLWYTNHTYMSGAKAPIEYKSDWVMRGGPNNKVRKYYNLECIPRAKQNLDNAYVNQLNQTGNMPTGDFVLSRVRFSNYNNT